MPGEICETLTRREIERGGSITMSDLNTLSRLIGDSIKLAETCRTNERAEEMANMDKVRALALVKTKLEEAELWLLKAL
jgi:hypothetical protein